MTNIAIENTPFVVDLPIQNGDFSIVMLVYQRVIYFYISIYMIIKKYVMYRHRKYM